MLPEPSLSTPSFGLDTCGLSSCTANAFLAALVAIVPKIAGCCISSPSRKNPITHVPSTGPKGEEPIPEIAAEVIGCIGVAQGRSLVGKIILLSV